MDIDKILRIIDRGDIKYAEVRYEKIYRENIELTNGELENVFEGYDEGVGIRVFSNGGWGFVALTSIRDKDLIDAVERAKKIAKSVGEKFSDNNIDIDNSYYRGNFCDLIGRDIRNVSYEEKISDIREIDGILSSSEEVKVRNIKYFANITKKILVNTLGSQLTHEVNRTYVSLSAVASRADKKSSYRGRVGKVGGYEIMDDALTEAEIVEEKVVTLLEARTIPGGKYTVLLDPELAGVFVHEALGHACEADLVVNGESILAGKIGNKIGNEIVTVFDDPTTKDGFGYIPFDDEGNEAKKKVLVENGILKNYILSKETAGKLGLKSNGGARAESFFFPPLVRMSNTYIGNGNMSFDELLEDIKYGIYLLDSRGGQVDTATGTFMFNAQEAYEIVNGEVEKPLRDVSLSGHTLEMLHNVDGVGDDLTLGVGFCGKGQTVPVGHGAPHIRVRNAIVGGR